MPNLSFGIPAPAGHRWSEDDAEGLRDSSVPFRVGSWQEMCDVVAADPTEDGLELRLTLSLPPLTPVGIMRFFGRNDPAFTVDLASAERPRLQVVPR